MDILELLRKRGVDGDVDFLLEMIGVVAQVLVEAETTVKIGAAYGKGSPDRVTQRNGYRTKSWDTRMDTMEMRIPKLRDGSNFPSLLEPWCWSEKARGPPDRTAGRPLKDTARRVSF